MNTGSCNTVIQLKTENIARQEINNTGLNGKHMFILGSKLPPTEKNVNKKVNANLQIKVYLSLTIGYNTKKTRSVLHWLLKFTNLGEKNKRKHQ